MLKNPQFQRQVIMDHYENPRNKKVHDTYVHKRMDSASCIDDITVYANVKDDIIVDISFEGVGCTISMASVSIMTELVKGKPLAEVKDIIENYFKMINLESYDEEILREAIVFQNVGRQANRIKCATLGWQSLVWIINEGSV